MKPIGDLAHLPEAQLFSEIANGLQLVADSALRLEADAQLLSDHNRARGCNLLANLAEEEAGKYLVLLDSVRCPRNLPVLERQLNRFYDHLAKGLYAQACMLSPSDFGEVARYLDRERRALYLDGDGELEWICRNSILQRRETYMYVDYVRTDSGHSWEIPIEDALGLPALHSTRSAVTLAKSLDDIGCSQVEALSVIAEIWRPVEMREGFHWTELRTLNQRTLTQLHAEGLLRQQPTDVYQYIIDRWSFPLHSLDLKLVKNDSEHLRRRQTTAIADG